MDLFEDDEKQYVQQVVQAKKNFEEQMAKTS